MLPLLVIGLPIAVGAGGGLLWGIRVFSSKLAEKAGRSFSVIWVALGLALLLPIVLPYLMRKKAA